MRDVRGVFAAFFAASRPRSARAGRAVVRGLARGRAPVGVWRRLSRIGLVDRGGRRSSAASRASSLFDAGLRRCSTSCSSRAGSWPFDPAHGPARPAVPAGVLGREHDRAWGSSSSRWRSLLWWVGAGGPAPRRTRPAPPTPSCRAGAPARDACGDGLPIARLFGIEIRVSFAWTLLIAVVTLLGAQQAVAHGARASRRRSSGSSASAIALGVPRVTVVAHELAHALVGRRCGVRVDDDRARLRRRPRAAVASRAATPGDELAIARRGAAACRVARRRSRCALGVLAPVGRHGRAGGAAPASLFVVGGAQRRPRRPQPAARDAARRRPRRPGDRLGADRRPRPRRADHRAGRPAPRLDGRRRRRSRSPSRTSPLEGLLVLALGWLLTTGARTLDRRLALERLLRGVPVARGDGGATPPTVAPNLTVDTFAARFDGRGRGSARCPSSTTRHVLGIIGAPPAPAAAAAPVRVHARRRRHGRPAAGAVPRARRRPVGRRSTR